MKASSERQIRWLCFKAWFRHRYIPPSGWNRVWFRGPNPTCGFSWKPCVRGYGGGVEHGIRYQWLGLEMACGHSRL